MTFQLRGKCQCHEGGFKVLITDHQIKVVHVNMNKIHISPGLSRLIPLWLPEPLSFLEVYPNIIQRQHKEFVREAGIVLHRLR